MEAEKMQQGARNPVKVNKILPGDIIEEILSRLPAKSLLRFRSVHKQWLSLISHPNFVQSNLKHVLSHNHLKKLMLLLSCQCADQFCSIDYESPGGSINAVKFNLPVSIPHTRFSVFGSCNGLLCIGIHSEEEVGVRFIIWNPLLKNYNQVIITDFGHPLSYYAHTHIGFGYDSVSDDYKLVSVDHDRDLVYVYTLKTNSSRSFPLELPLVIAYCPVHDHRATFFNGSLYWLAETCHSGSREVLIWFDLKDEKFGMVEVPLDHDRSIKAKSWGSELIVARGCLYIFTMDLNNLYLKLLMAKVDKCNVVSWSVGPNLEQPYEARPICLTTDGGILMRVKNNFVEKDKREERLHKQYGPLSKLIINHPHNGTVKNILVDGFSEWFEATTYLETLVSPI